MIIRSATPQDAKGIANVHVKSWQTTYTGIMPDEVIQSRGMDNRLAIWTRILSNPNPDTVLLVAEDDKQIVGFVQGGKPQEAIENYDSELYAIYLLQDAQGKGLGRRLMEACAKVLCNKGHHSLMLWVLKGNDDSCGYYEYMGGKLIAESDYAPMESFTIKKLAYGWDDIRTLLTES